MSGGLPWGPPGGGVSSFSLDGGEPKPYDEEARHTVALLLQRNMLETQTQEFRNVLSVAGASSSSSSSSSAISSSSSSSSSSTVPAILKMRNLPEELQQTRRLLDDVEITILGILDSNGIITLNTRMSDFIVLMTRIGKLEHKSLCITILRNNVSEESILHFVKEGGLLMLKRWLEAASRDNFKNADLMCTILQLCETLPVDRDIIIETNFNNIIVDLNNQIKNVDKLKKLQSAIKAVKAQWRERATTKKPADEAKKVAVEPPPAIAAVVATLGQRILEDRGPPAIVIDVEPPVVVISTTSSSSNSPGSASVSSSKSSSSRDANVDSSDKTSSKGSGKLKRAASSISNDNEDEPSLSSSALVDSGVVLPPEKKATQKTSMQEKIAAANENKAPAAANPISQQQQQQQEEYAANPASTIVPEISKLPPPVSKPKMQKVTMAEQAKKFVAQKEQMAANDAQNAKQVASQNSHGVEPGPSILKRKADGGAAPPSKRARLELKFADDCGQELTQTLFFEVDTVFKRSIQNEKSRKNHKEMMKRERLLEKVENRNRNLMQRTMDWSTPPALQLSVEITENSHSAVVSPECEDQLRRVAHKLEARYVDNSLIPPDPEEPPPDDGVPSEEGGRIVYVEWETETLSAPVMDGPLPGLYSALPPCLHVLEPELLQVLVQDESLIVQMILDDGVTLNATKVEQLRHFVHVRGGQGVPFPPSAAPVASQFGSSGYGNGISSNGRPMGEAYDSYSQDGGRQNAPFNAYAGGGASSAYSSSSSSSSRFDRQDGRGNDRNERERRNDNRRNVLCKLFSVGKPCSWGVNCNFIHDVNRVQRR